MPNQDDDLLKRMERLKKNADRGQKNASDAHDNVYAKGVDGLREAGQGLKTLGILINRMKDVGLYYWEKAAPAREVVGNMTGWFTRFYRDKIWNRYAYEKNEKDEPVFSKKRAGIVLTATFAAVALAPAIIGGTVDTGVDVAKMALTTREESVYLHTPNAHGDDSYSVKGCKTKGKCEPEDVVYYNVESSLMKHLYTAYNRIAKGEWPSLYIPKNIIGVIPPGDTNKCAVKIYGAYYADAWKQLNVYPDLLDVSCVRVNGAEKPVDASFSAASIPVQAAHPAPAPAGH